MVERGFESRESVQTGEILVCKAVHEWSAPASHPNDQLVYIWDRENWSEYLTQSSLETVADWLHKGLFSIGIITRTGQERQVFHNPPVSGFTLYADGYFGRPLIPESYFSLHSLEQEQIKIFKEALSSLRKQTTSYFIP